MPGTLLIRADASTEIGTGHVMRCLALAQAWQDAGGQSIFGVAMESPVLEARLKSEGMQVVHLVSQAGSKDDALEMLTLARKTNAAWVAVDGYHFGIEYQRVIKGGDLQLLFIDDNGHAENYCADMILNQNIHAHESLYKSRESYTKLLLGTQYVLLRREFWKWRGWKREISEVGRRILVTLGGSDPHNLTIKVIQAIREVDLDGIELIAVVGPLKPNDSNIAKEQFSVPFPLRILSSVVNMSELMAWADVAVSGGGTSCWELAFMGLPAMVMVLAENQETSAKILFEEGVFIELESPKVASIKEIACCIQQLLVSSEIRHRASQKGFSLVDGEGKTRVLEALLNS